MKKRFKGGHWGTIICPNRYLIWQAAYNKFDAEYTYESVLAPVRRDRRLRIEMNAATECQKMKPTFQEELLRLAPLMPTRGRVDRSKNWLTIS